MRAIVLAIAALVLCSPARAQYRDKIGVLPEYRLEGRSIIPFSTSCSSSAWTIVVASDTISRSVLYLVPTSTPTMTVCLSTSQASGVSCVDATPGVEIAAGLSLTDYTTSAFYCRSRAGTLTGTVKGYRSRDSLGDAGYIALPGMQ